MFSVEIRNDPKYVNKSVVETSPGVYEPILPYQGTPYSSVVLNYDNDQFKDLFITIQDYPSQLFRGGVPHPSGEPKFDLTTEYEFAFAERPDIGLGGCSIADFDQDGHMDIFAAAGNSGSGNARLYRYDPTTTDFEDMADDFGFNTIDDHSWAGSWGDYDRDGDLDLYMSCAQVFAAPDYPTHENVVASQDYLLRNDCSGDTLAFTDVTDESWFGYHVPIASVSASWNDVDGDCFPDLLVGNIRHQPSGPGPDTQLLMNRQDGTFIDEFNLRIGDGQAYISGVQWADVNNDGYLDIVMSSHTDFYSSYIFYNDKENPGHFTERYLFRNVAGFQGLSVFDADLDGHQDVMFLPEDEDEHPYLFAKREVGGELVWQDESVAVGLAESIGKVNGIVASDFNDDGDLDIYFGRPVETNVTDTKYFYKMVLDDGSEELGRKWCGLDLRVGALAVPAIGAKVTFSAGGFTQTQIVDGGSGRGGQQDLVLICGLGKDFEGGVDYEIQWPSGRIQSDTIDEIDLNGVITITESEHPGIVESSVAGTYEIVGIEVNWVFRWQSYLSDPEDDYVLIEANTGPGCFIEATELHRSMTQVTSSITPLPGGLYQHELSWEGRNCVPRCVYQFKVKSKRNNVVDVCNNFHDLRIRFCPLGR